jgi:peptidoglycan-associated lipoprotein
MTERIYFDFDKSVLKMESQALLKKKAEWLKANASSKMLIEGNTDERGTAEYNLALGERRAESAKKFLTDLGIDAKRISTISYGEERPIDPQHNEAAWARNRNDGFVIN